MDARKVAEAGAEDASNDIILSGLRILELYGPGTTALTTQEIAELAGLPLGRTRRLVDTLTRFRYITRLPDSGRYWPQPIVRAMRQAFERSTSGVLERLLILAPDIFQQAFSTVGNVALSIDVRDGLRISSIKTWATSLRRRSHDGGGQAIPLHQCPAGLAWVWAEKFEAQVDLLKQINLIGTKTEIAGMFDAFAQLTREGIYTRQPVDQPNEWHFAIPVKLADSVVAVISCRANLNEKAPGLAEIREALRGAAAAITHAL